MDEIPTDLKAKLEDRVREEIACEVRGDVTALYEFILPKIRADRIAKRDDEPELTLSEIRKFVSLVRSAEVLSFRVKGFFPSVAQYSGCPVAFVVAKVRYNGSAVSGSECGWVYSEGMWFTTAVGKFWLDAPPGTSAGDK